MREPLDDQDYHDVIADLRSGYGVEDIEIRRGISQHFARDVVAILRARGWLKAIYHGL